MRISEILSSSLIKTDLKVSDKYGAFEELIALLSVAGLVKDAEAAYDAVVDREKKMSTDIIPYVALPHGKLKEVKDVAVALGISKEGVDFVSDNGKPVKIIFLVLSEEGNPGPHLGILAEISRLLSDDGFVQSLMNAANPEDVMRLIATQE